MIQYYTISVLLKDRVVWFEGEADFTIGVPHAAWSGQSFQVARKEMTALTFTDEKARARRMTSRNMRSWLERILEQMPYWDTAVKEIRINAVEDEMK